jgi:hypothetical protein
MARKAKPAQLAHEAALRGEVEAAVALLEANLAGGDRGAAASLAEVAAFRGRWDEAVSHAEAFLQDPLSAGTNLIDDVLNLLAVAGFETGDWGKLHARVAAIDARAKRTRGLGVDRARLDQLVELTRSGGASYYVWDWGNETELDEDARAAQFDEGVVSLTQGKKKMRFKTDAERRRHFFAYANALRSHWSAVRLFDAEGIDDDAIGFDHIAFTASGLARAGRPDEAWQLLERKIHLWWPIHYATVAPVELLADEALRPLMTLERRELVLRTPKGSEAAAKKK